MEKEMLKKPWLELQVTEIAVKTTEEKPGSDRPPGGANGKLSTGGDAYGLGHS